MEKVVHRQLNKHLHDNNLLEVFQSGFWNDQSTETALFKVSDDLLVASGSGLLSVLLLLDFGAVFHTVDHSILLKKLEYAIGIKQQAFN